MKRTIAFILVLKLVGLCLGADEPVWKKVVSPAIAYKYITSYDKIWQDKGTWKFAGAKGAIWRPKNYDSDFCLLGDVAKEGYNTPTNKAVAVKNLTAGALVHPTGFTEVWDDHHALSSWDCTVYKMNAPKGYTCLGAVAMKSFTAKPDTNKFCCVKDEYVVSSGNFKKVWDDDGLKAFGQGAKLSLYTVQRGDSDGFGLEGGNFETVNAYHSPKSVGHLLKDDEIHVKNIHDILPAKTAPLNLLKIYEVTNPVEIWNDKGSGADKDVSIWRAVNSNSAYHSVGDIAVNSHNNPNIAFLMKPSNTEDVRKPVDFNEIWNDGGSGADKDVKIWRVVCPATFVALGNVATNGEKPDIDSISCVHKKYTEQGYNDGNSWSLVWKDYGSGAHKDVSIYEAKAKSTQQTIRGFGAIRSHSGYPGTPFFLKKSAIKYYSEKPVSKIVVTDITYDFDNVNKLPVKPAEIVPTIVRNPTDVPQQGTRTIKYTNSKSSTFTFSESIEYGISTTVEIGVPIPEILAQGKMSATATFKSTTTFSVGETYTTSFEDTTTVPIVVPKHTNIKATVTFNAYTSDVPFTATIIKTYYDGTTGDGEIRGKYRGMNVLEADIKYEEI